MKVYDQHAVGVFECLWMNQKHEGRIHVMITMGVTHFGNQKIYRYYSKEPKIQWDFMLYIWNIDIELSRGMFPPGVLCIVIAFTLNDFVA